MDRMRYLFGVATLIVMVVGGYFLFTLLGRRDNGDRYQIEVTFLDARGLKAGADVKYRGIQVGTVREVGIDDDGQRAILSVVMDEGEDRWVRDNSTFWIVTPRFHGLSDGVSGLETLVRDAFVSFSNPKEPGSPLAAGSRLTGAEAPEIVRLPTLRRGDLLMRVLIPENHGVTVGARVMYRGMATGEVRSIELAPSGSHVSVSVRISSDYRSTVTDTSKFWVAKPQVGLQFSLSNPLSVRELGALISPHIAYFTPPLGVPLSDGDVVAAELQRPDIEIPGVPERALQRPLAKRSAETKGPLILVRVIYAAEDVDWLSPNDPVHREGTGVLFLDSNNQPCVLTARSVCDAGYYFTETFGWDEINNERIRVQLHDGQALTATRSWVDKGGSDLAILRVEGLPRDYPTSKPTIFSYAEYAPPGKGAGPQATVEKVHATGEAGVRLEPVSLGLVEEVKLDKFRGGVVMRGESLVGLLGQVSDEEEKTKIVSLAPTPEPLRPAK